MSLLDSDIGAVVDPSEAVRELLVRAFERAGLGAESHDQIASLWHRLREPTPPQLLLVRFAPEYTESTWKQLRTAVPVHVVALADRGMFPAVIGALESGLVDDVLETPVELDRALHRILVGRRSLALRRRLERREAPTPAPTRDPVTGLWNRSSAVDLLRRELAAARRTGAHVGLVRLRLIGLEEHISASAADLAFRLVADALRVSVRVSDWVARLGPLTFAVVLPGCAEPRTIAIGERIFRLATERLESSGVFASLRVEAEASAIAPDHPDSEKIIAGLEVD